MSQSTKKKISKKMLVYTIKTICDPNEFNPEYLPTTLLDANGVDFVVADV